MMIGRLTRALCWLLQTSWYYVEPWVLFIIWDLVSLSRKALREDPPSWFFLCFWRRGSFLWRLWIHILLLFLTDCIVWGTWLRCEMGCLKITALAHTVPVPGLALGGNSLQRELPSPLSGQHTLFNKEEINKPLKRIPLLVLLRKDKRWLGVCH